MSVLLEIAIVMLLIFANGLFAMSEMAVISARKARLQQRASRGDPKARAALKLANAPNQFLSTVQIGITLVGILVGAFGGATIAEQLAMWLSRFAWLAPYSEAIGLGIVVLGITYLSLVLGELVPKRLALNNPEQIAATVAAPMRALSALASPVIRLLGASTEVVLRGLGARPSTEPPITEEEIKLLVEQGVQVGVFEAAEQEMVVRVFRFGDRRLGALMTPRVEIVWLNADDSPEAIHRTITGSAHSMFPVGQGSLDNPLGVAHVKDILACSLAGEPTNLRAVLKPPLLVPESITALKVLELFKQSGRHLALVMDEYSGIQGLVTHTDILEALVGDMPVVAEQAEPQVVQRQDGSWLLNGMLLVDEFKEIFHLERLPGEDQVRYQTVGGLVMASLGRIPLAGESFEWRGLHFEVMDMDGHRVDKVLVMPKPARLEERYNHVEQETHFNA
jgi:putative hemolysin